MKEYFQRMYLAIVISFNYIDFEDIEVPIKTYLNRIFENFL